MSTKIDITDMFPELPHYLTVYKVLTEATYHRNTLEDEGANVGVEVHSTIHVNKVVTLPALYSEGYINRYPNRWASDILMKIVRRYGLTVQPRQYA